MSMYLFTDGTNRVQEAHSDEELLSLINSVSDQSKARIWVYNTNEWVTCPSFIKKYPGFPADNGTKTIANNTGRLNTGKSPLQWMRRSAIMALVIAGTLLVFNFTNATWEKAAPLKTSATRPLNMPDMNIDSLISEIEITRGKTLDKNTRHNLRMRNTWPDNILLELNAEKKIKGSLSQYYNLSLKLDNASGFILDEVQVKLLTWKKGKANLVDIIQFRNASYDKLLTRKVAGTFRCDSISAAFYSIRAKAFNFCFSENISNNSGNNNDRWFCREGKLND